MVVLGALQGSALPQEALDLAQKVAPWELAPRLLSGEDRSMHNLEKDGCPEVAVMLVYTSVRGANQAVAALHGQVAAGTTLWARQFGGEGAKLKKCRLIVRNLPFQVTKEQLREVFSAAGFVWEATLPPSADGRGRGFAFIGYTSSPDAEKAVKSLNGVKVGGRPVAVDWAVAKREYDAASAAGKAIGAGEAVDAMDTDNEGEEDEDDEEEDSKNDGRLQPASPPRSAKALEKEGSKNRGVAGRDSEPQRGAAGASGKEEGPEAEEDAGLAPPDEGQLMRQVMERVLAASPTAALEEDEILEGVTLEEAGRQPGKGATSAATGGSEPKREKSGQRQAAEGERAHALGGQAVKKGEGNAELASATLFVRRIPLDAQAEEVREAFAKFGPMKACRLVLHPVTKRPKGTAFIEYRRAEAAQAAVDAAERKGGKANGSGVVVRGSQVSVSLAVGKEEARQISRQKAGSEGGSDKRSLHLAQEGVILEGSQAAQEMSAADRTKRERLRQEKASKLRSPNFVVSRTRLAVHNVPQGMGEGALQQLFLRAVKERATKQSPTITQVKVLRDKTKRAEGGTARSRGAAFVEFSEHEHAMAALRALNNHPGAFTPDRRPIVEFAIENRLLTKKREGLKAQHKRRSDGAAAEGSGWKREKPAHGYPAQGKSQGVGQGGLRERGDRKGALPVEPRVNGEEQARKRTRGDGPRQGKNAEQKRGASGPAKKVARNSSAKSPAGGSQQPLTVKESSAVSGGKDKRAAKAKKRPGQKNASKATKELPAEKLQLDTKKLGDLKRWFE